MKKILATISLIFLATAALVYGVFQTEFGETLVNLEEYRKIAAPETGIEVDPVFEPFYNSLPEARIVLGNPTTIKFRNKEVNLDVQYFQKGRLEDFGHGDIRITTIGSYMVNDVADVPDEPLGAAGACRKIGDFMVCDSFLLFYDTYGGEEVFGLPLSNIKKLGETSVQYFENFRLEWFPGGAPYGISAKVSDFGYAYFAQLSENPPRAEYFSPIDVVDVADTTLIIHAFPDEPAVSSDEELNIYVVVKDQNGQFLEDGSVTMKLTYPTSADDISFAGETNDKGVTSQRVPLRSDPADYGMIVVEVEVSFPNGLRGTAQTSFRLVP